MILKSDFPIKLLCDLLGKSRSLLKEFDTMDENNHSLKEQYNRALKTGENLLSILIEIDAIESQLEWDQFRAKRKSVINEIQLFLDRIDTVKDDLKTKI
jgi:DNA-binding transcriptional regulator WhiA